MDYIRLKEVYELTSYGNKEVCEWINKTWGHYDLLREAAYATVRWLGERYPELNTVLRVKTTREETKG